MCIHTHTDTMEYYSTIKIMKFYLENTKLSEVSQRKKILYNIIYM